jgi:pSer/pThr/pTyr-binding forkhead associated (FHA) protein
MIRMLVKYKDRTIKEFALDRIDSLSIGRNPNHHLVIDNFAVSGNHAVILREGNRFILKGHPQQKRYLPEWIDR